MIPSEATFQAYGKIRSAAFLLDMASRDEVSPEFRKCLERLTSEVSTMSSVVETVAYALRDHQPAQA